MPSLRRTLSSPAVRSSPYPSQSSSSSAQRSHAPGPRRASGSETINRRVLADIYWWKVVDGQDAGDVTANSDPGQLDLAQPYIADYIDTGDVFGVDRPLFTESWNLPGAFEILPFEALSIPPQTPPRRNHSRESSVSSEESTPDSSAMQLEGMRLGLEELDLSASSRPFSGLKRHHTAPVFSFLSGGFGSFDDHFPDSVDDIVDLGLSSHHDSHGFFA